MLKYEREVTIMADNTNFAERFSNDQYLTYNQITVELKTTLIGPIWDKVLEYRGKFTLPLTLRTVDKSRYKVVLTPKITEKITTIERKLTKALISYSTFIQNEDYKRELEIIQTKNIISNIAAVYDVDVNENFYQRLVTHNLSTLTPSEMILNDYHRALTYLTTNVFAPLDKNFIIGLADIFDALENANYIYRSQEVKDQSQKALVNRIFVAAPVNRIEEMVEDLLDFIQSSQASLFVKFVAIFFYFCYIKPFSYHSEEIALLFSKAFLQRGDLEALAPLLNLEILHDEAKEKLDEIMLEVKKSNDLTYLIVYIADLFVRQINQLEELMVEIRRKMISQERYQPEPTITKAPEVKEVIPAPIKVEPVIEKIEEEASLRFEQTNLLDQEEEKPQVTPILEKPVVTATTPPPTLEVNPTYQVPPTMVHKQDEGVKLETWMDIALPRVPVGLSEEDAQKIETHLREMDPSLSRSEAYFYARHCTIGKYYTISQFKESVDCAYETARTSMDHLANSGYYRKEKFKNKFLYTPVKR